MPRRTPKTSKPPTKPTRRRPVAWRPPSGGFEAALDRLHAGRPEHVPEGAFMVAAFVEVPGENTQRTGHWAKNSAWKKKLVEDFTKCAELQPHPGVLDDPRVHIQLSVLRAGDNNNRLSRAKYLIDTLQIHKKDKNGKRSQGLLGLIHDDSVLTDHNRTIEEVRGEVFDTGKFDRAGLAIRQGHFRAVIWVWRG